MKSTGRVREEKRRKRKSQKKEDPGARKGRKVAKHCVFPMICGSGGSKSRLAKAAGAEPAGQMRDEKVARRCGAKHISKSKCTKHLKLGELSELARRKSARRCGAKHISKSCSTSYDLWHHFSWQGQYFRQVECKNRKRNWYEAVDSALHFPFLKEVAQNCFVFDVVNFETWGSLAELFRFWCCQLRKLRKSRRIVSFLMLKSKIEDVSQNCFVFDVVKFKNWESLAELFRFWRCQVQKLRRSRKIAAFSNLQIDR